MLHRFSNIVERLTVFPERMKSNMGLTYGLIYSQRVMLKLIDSGMTREQAYDLVQPLTKQSWDKGIQFRDLVEGSKPITDALNEEQNQRCI